MTAIDQVRGLGYKLFLVLHPENTTTFSTEEVQSLADTIAARIMENSEEGELNMNISAWIDDDNSCRSAKLGHISVLASFVGNKSLGRGEYEEDLLERSTGDWATVIKETGKQLTLKSIMLGMGFKSLAQSNVTNETCFIALPEKLMEKKRQILRGFHSFESTVFVTPSEEIEISSSESCDSFVSNMCLTQQGWVVYRKKFSSMPPPHLQGPIWMFQDKFIDVSHSLTCPNVLMNISKSNVTVDTAEINFNYMGHMFIVNGTDHITIGNDEVLICIDAFKRLMDQVIIEGKQSTLKRVHHYLEIICISFSIVCLFLSALTYCLFPSLRSLPGLNNLSLCVTLAVAQTCLLVTARWGIEQRLPKGYCLTHALLLHYSWLSAFAWMSICCIHMFRVFRTHDNTFLDSSSDGKRFRFYCFYGFGVPALIVIANSTINAGVSRGESSGYNGNICFLDTRRSMWTLVFSLLVPLSSVILTNSIMFAMTVKEISHVSQAHVNNERQGIITYLKLSTLTGLLGAVVVLAVQLDNEIFSILVSPLMALQGVFIFFSFTCNKKVQLLYLDLLQNYGKTERTTRSLTSDTKSAGSSAAYHKTKSTRV